MSPIPSTVVAATLLVSAFAVSTVGAPAGAATGDPVLINEFVGSTTGTDIEYIELFGDPAQPLDGLSLIVVESDAGASNGAIDTQIDLSGERLGATNGFFLVGVDAVTVTYGVTPDLAIPTDSIENSSYTLALVETSSISGTSVSGSEVVLDAVGVSDGGPTDSFFFGAPVIGPDGTFLPAGGYRLTDGVDTDTVADWGLTNFFNASPPNSPTAGRIPPPPFECGAGTLTAIHDVQGNGVASPLEGQTVRVQGVVTLVTPALRGFFLQEEDTDADGDPATSEGVYVAGSTAGVTNGSIVEVEGEVDEFFGETRVLREASAECAASGPAPTPTSFSLPADAVRREALEGMVVTTAQDLTVTALFSAYRFGELGVSSDGVLDQPTSVFKPQIPPATALAEANADNLLKLDDRGEFGNDNDPWAPDPATPVRAGDTLPAGATGPLSFTFGEYKIQPIGDFPTVVPAGSRPAAPSLDDGNDVGAFNVLNYFTTFGERGAANQAQFDLQSAKIVSAVNELDAAVLGLIELENNYDEATPAVADLVDKLNADAGFSKWDWVRTPGNANVGTDAIAVGIIYQPARAQLEGDSATFDIDSLLGGDDPDNNRWPLAQTFEIDGEEFTIVVNHFKSKGSSCAATTGPGFTNGDGDRTDLTGNCDLVRQYASRQLLQWIRTNPTNADEGGQAAFIVGDLNSYQQEQPIKILQQRGYVDLVDKRGDDASTFKFDGRYGRLDYVMASPRARNLVDDAAVWQANSPEFSGYLYFNDPIDTAATATPYASSDHDPVVVSLRDR